MGTSLADVSYGSTPKRTTPPSGQSGALAAVAAGAAASVMAMAPARPAQRKFVRIDVSPFLQLWGWSRRRGWRSDDGSMKVPCRTRMTCEQVRGIGERALVRRLARGEIVGQ